MILVDWGTTRFRACRMAGGVVRDRMEADRGILAVQGRFADTLRDAIAPWLAGGETRVLVSGMAGSRQGWVETPYVPCPAGPDELATALTPAPFEGAQVLLAPGVSGADAHGVPEVMRGEEMQALGEAARTGPDALLCLPGTHSKWVRLEGGGIAGFATHLTGEAYAALRGHTILGRLMADAPHDPAAFEQGVARSGQAGGLLHHLFGVRALGLLGGLGPDAAPSYLSGLLIGAEVRAASPAGPVHLVGAPDLCARYADAIALCSGHATTGSPDAAAHGMALVAERAAWT